MNAGKIRALLAEKSGGSGMCYDRHTLASLNEFLVQPDICDYLLNCLPRDVVIASGVRLLPLRFIENEMAEGAAPGSFVRPYGYLIIATSIGGNAVCFHSPSGNVLWADHTSFTTSNISYEDRKSKEWKYFHEYSINNVRKAMVPLGDDIETFLCSLLSDQIVECLDALDS
jgi:hypothetical protein